MATFLKVLKLAAKYGAKAVKWCWEHKSDILKWGLTAIDIIANLFG